MKMRVIKNMDLYVSLGSPLEFGVWNNTDRNKPIGWHKAEDVINPNYQYNKLKMLTKSEVKQIKNAIFRFNEK